MGERTRVVNRMKACLIRLGIRNFKPTLRKAPERLEALLTPEGAPLPPNTSSGMRCDMARLRFVENQIKEIKATPYAKAGTGASGGTACDDPLIGARYRRWRRNGGYVGGMRYCRAIFRDQKAVARYAGLTGSPDESGKRSREKGLSRVGNARVRRGIIQLAWRFLMFQKESALAQWSRRGHKGDARGPHAENHDRRISAKASSGDLAYGDDWGDSGRSRDAYRSLSADAWSQRDFGSRRQNGLSNRR